MRDIFRLAVDMEGRLWIWIYPWISTYPQNAASENGETITSRPENAGYFQACRGYG